jgi:hypothetical protein
MAINPAEPLCTDFDLHGIVGVRLVHASPADVDTVRRQLGPLQATLTRDPDIVIRFVEAIQLPAINYVELKKNGFTPDGFFILQNKKTAVRVRIPFEAIGSSPCELVCQRGLRAIPLLMAIVNLVALRKGYVAVHGSAFHYQGIGVLLVGWAKGGKTEGLLSFAARGARYVGDEWIWLSSDGKWMYGIPENIRLWDWHIAQVPSARRQLATSRQLLFSCIRQLDVAQRHWNRSTTTAALPSLLQKTLAVLTRQCNVQFPPQAIFGNDLGPFQSRLDRVVLMINHNRRQISLESADSQEIAVRMAASNRLEQLPFLEHYWAFRFAFPALRNQFLDWSHELQRSMLRRALAGKEGWTVKHPYPVAFADLFEAMQPICSDRQGPRSGTQNPYQQVIA